MAQAELLDRAADVFAASSKPDEPVIDLRELHAKIGMLGAGYGRRLGLWRLGSGGEDKCKIHLAY